MEKYEGGTAGGSSKRTLAAEFDEMLYAKINWSSRCSDPYDS